MRYAEVEILYRHLDYPFVILVLDWQVNRSVNTAIKKAKNDSSHPKCGVLPR